MPISISESVPEWTALPFPLDKAVWPLVLLAIGSVLNLSGVERLEVMHGWTESELANHPDFPALQWQTQTYALAELRPLIRERQAMGMCLGRDDVFLEGESPVPWQILLCHEADVHVTTRHESLIAALQSSFAPLDIVLRRNGKETL